MRRINVGASVEAGVAAFFVRSIKHGIDWNAVNLSTVCSYSIAVQVPSHGQRHYVFSLPKWHNGVKFLHMAWLDGF